MSDAALILSIEAQVAALQLRLPGLDGKQNKRERSAVNKEIYQLESGAAYAEAVRRRLAAERAAAATSVDAGQAERLGSVLEAVAATRAAQGHTQKGLSEIEERHFQQQVEALFDDYAGAFEAALCEGLHYRTPEIIAEQLLARSGRTARDVDEGVLSRLSAVDFGCGTGLAGAVLRPRCRGRLIGCDLSRGMLKVAATKHPETYDELVAADAVAFLRRLPPASADLVVGADVCVYMRSLSDLVASAAAVLVPGGVCVFSTELARLEEVEGGLPPTGAGYVERPSERIAHAREYIEWLVTPGQPGSAFELLSIDEVDLRMDGGRMIRGQIALLAKG